MYYFSDEFLVRLKTKSENFQNAFSMLWIGCVRTVVTISLFRP